MPLTTYIVPFHETARWFHIYTQRLLRASGHDPRIIDLGIARKMLEYVYLDIINESALWRKIELTFRPAFEDWLDSVGVPDQWVKENIGAIHMRAIKLVSRNLSIGIPEDTWDVWCVQPYNLDLKIVNLGDYRIIQWELQNKGWEPVSTSAEEIAISQIPESRLFSISANISQSMIEDSANMGCATKVGY